MRIVWSFYFKEKEAEREKRETGSNGGSFVSKGSERRLITNIFIFIKSIRKNERKIK